MNSINQIISLSSDLMRSLLTWSWQAFFLLGAVWVGLRLNRSQSPAARYRIWLIALSAVSALPLLTSLSHSLDLPSAMAPFPIEITGDTPTFEEISEHARPAISWPSLVWPIAFGLWAAGVITSLLRLAISLRRLHIIQSCARPIPIIDLGCAHSDLLYSDAGGISIVLSDGIQAPGLVGLFHPVILLPADIALWTSPHERTSILRHELAHIKRHDHLVSLFQSVLGAFFFFHPMLRYGSAQLSLEREFACDDHVIGLGTEPKAYAESILKAVERTLLTDIVHQIPSFASRRTLERRIEMILDKNRVRQPLRHWQSLLLPIMLIATITWLVIPAASSQTRIKVDDTRSAPDGSNSVKPTFPASAQTQASPVVDRATITVDSVKRGPMVRQVRGLGVLAPGDDGRLKAEFGIPEPQPRNIKIGQPVSIETSEGSIIRGKVAAIGSGDTNGIVRVGVILEGNLPGSIQAGVQVDGVIEVERVEDRIYVARPVPAHADSTSTLFKVEADGLTATRVRVEFGRSSATTIEIIDGLKVGDKVIVSDMSAYEGVAKIKLN